MRRCYIEEWDLYRIVRDFYADDKIFNGGETTTRMLFLGNADKDLRCVRFGIAGIIRHSLYKWI